MVHCPRCGAECSEQDVKDGRCFRCATFIADAGSSEPARTVAFHQQEAQSESDFPVTTGVPAIANSDPGKMDLIRPRNLSPEYERHIAEEWHATILKASDVDDTIKKGASPAEDSFDLNIGSRHVTEDLNDSKADYVLLEPIGKGGMGQVWSARQASLDRLVAIKIPHADVSREKASDSRQSTEARNQFVSEIVVTGRLDHPNIVPIHDIAHTQDGQLFCSMKKVDGRPWNACIHLPEFNREKNLEILMKVCDAVRYSHDKHGIIHRDLKPDNIVVGDFGEVSVMDFGLALEMDKLDNSPLKLAGTARYMAPEMASLSAADLGFHTDVYLIGAILYEIITGSAPHHIPAPTGSTTKWVDDVKRIVSRNEIVPAKEKGELVDIAYQALATNISDRFQTVQEFQNAIRDFREHQKSVTLAKRGFDYLDKAMQNGRKATDSGSQFDEYDRARFAFDEAIQLWGSNREAKNGAAKTRVEYAKYALNQQAYAQGISLLDEKNLDHTSLLKNLQKAKRRQENVMKAKKRLWQSIFALAGIIAVGSVAASMHINILRGEAIGQKLVAQESKVDTMGANLLATEKEVKASFNEVAAIGAKLEALKAQQRAQDEERRATKAKLAAQEARKEAVRSAYEAEIGLAAAEAKRNAFDNLRESLFRIDQAFRPEVSKSGGKNSQSKTTSKTIHSDTFEMQETREAFRVKKKALKVSLVETKDELKKNADFSDLSIEDALKNKYLQQRVAVLSRLNEVDLSALQFDEQRRDKHPRNLEEDGNGLAEPSSRQDPSGWELDYLKFLGSNQLGITDLVQESPSADEYECVAVTPDLDYAAAGTSDGKLYIWQKKESSNDFRQSLEQDFKESEHGKILSVAIEKIDDSYCLLAMASKKGVSLLDLRQANSGQVSPIPLGVPKASGLARCVAFSANGKKLAASWQDGHVAVWSLNGAQASPHLWVMKRHDSGVGSIKFSSDGHRLVTASDDGLVLVWNAADGKLITTFSNGTTSVYTAAFLPGGQHIIAGDREGKILVWQVPSEARAENYDNRTNSHVRKRLTIQAEKSVSDPPLATWNAHSAAVRSIAVSKVVVGETKIFSAGHDNTLQVWNLSQGFDQASLVKTLRGHGGWVRSCAISSDGSTLLSAGYDGRVRRWDWQTYRIAQILKPSPKFRPSSQQFTSVSYSRDGKWIATTSNDGLLTFWDMEASEGPKPQYPTEGHDMLATSVVPFSDGKFILTSAGDNTTRIWEVSTGREVVRFGGQWQRSDGSGTGYRGIAAVSADGKFIATGSDPMPENEQPILAKIWNWRDKDPSRPIAKMLTPKNAVVKGEKPEATALAFSPDGTSLLIGDQFGACRLYALSDGHLIANFNHRGKVTDAKFVSVDVLFTSSSDGTVIQWKIKGDSVTQELQIRHGKRRVAAMDVSNTERYVVTASVAQDKKTHEYNTKFHYWDLSKKQGDRLSNSENPDDDKIAGIASHLEFHPLKPSVVLVTMFSPKGFGPDHARYSVGEWNFSAGVYAKRRQSKASEIAMATYLPKRGRSSFVTIGGRGARFIVDKKTEMTFRAQQSMTSGSFSPDSKNFVCASTDGTVKFWSLGPANELWKSSPTRKLLSQHRPSGSPNGIRSVLFHPVHSNLLLSAGEDGKAIVWKKNGQAWDRRILLDEHEGPLSSAIFSSDGNQILTGGSDKIVRIWNLDLENSQADVIRSLLHDAPVEAIAIAPSNKQIVVAVGNEAHIWDLTSDAERPTRLRGHAAEVTAVTFCRNKNRVGTASKDQTIRIWDTSDLNSEPKPLLTLEGHTGHVTSVAYVPENINYDKNRSDGAYLLTGSLDGQVILWPSMPLVPLEK